MLRRGEYEFDKSWADQFLPQIERILRDVIKPQISVADFNLDTSQATDLISGAIGPIAFAARLRREGVFHGRSFNSPTHWGLQFTIRSHRDSGIETELAKIKKGFADIYLYGHIERKIIRHWIVLDLNVFRRNLASFFIRFENQDNRDGTQFLAFDIRSFPDELIVAASSTMRLALENGVNAVLPIKDDDFEPHPWFVGRCCQCGEFGLYVRWLSGTVYDPRALWYCDKHRLS